MINGAKILFADDDVGMRLLIRESLERSGFQVLEAENGEQLLDLFELQNPDLIMLDVMMPDIDGFTLCKQIRESEKGQAVPILLATGCDDLDSIDEAYKVGATDFIAKPINWGLLGYRVKYLIRSSFFQKELVDNQNKLEYAQKIAKVGSWELQGGQLECSKQTLEIFSIQEKKRLSKLQHLIDQVHIDDSENLLRHINESLDENKEIKIEFRVEKEGEEEKFILCHGEPKVDEKSIGLTGIFQDITEQKKQEERIIFLAYHDLLTGLANSRLFKDRLQGAISFAERHKLNVAVLSVNIDRFKRINDTLGNDVGDELLKIVATRVDEVIRGSDFVARKTNAEESSVSRFSGDDFTVMLSQVPNSDVAGKVASRVIQKLSEPCYIDDHEVFITASTGISIFPDDGLDVETLVRNSNSALEHAKQLGGNRFSYYEEKMNSSSIERLHIENDLRKALALNEFVLFYQPQVDGHTGDIIGAEALMRWDSAERGMVAPFHFIPVLEETGMIIEVGEWVLRTACAQQKKWAEQGKKLIDVSVNLSAKQFAQDNFVDLVKQIISDTNANPERIVLEITESLLLDSGGDVVSQLQQFRDMGFCISIDDFGTGYSSLSYLRNLPINELKIDRSFVKDIATDLDDGTIAKTIIALAKNLQLNVIAEGVEDQPQLEFLLSQGCDRIQGYYFGKPVPAEELLLPDA
ncbi:MAG: EAL domain-containing protein [Gammaproteobacteria bacterium]|nr:MAG: EAL domain-containing protein [Gammaproteobacteria bacterium]